MLILGMDEAGRGSVLGPLVVGAFLWEAPAGCALHDVAAQAPLRAAGAADSKALSPKRRVQARAALAPMGSGLLRQATAVQIDGANINHLEEAAFIELIVQTRPARVYLDAPVHPRGIPALERRLADAISSQGVAVPQMVVQPKADVTWPVVGAASIFAKVARDAAMAALSVEYGQPLGSGYPSDPVSRRWISGYLQRDEPLPACVRSRWGTIDKLRQQPLF
ncbi:MAG: ribonuclease HII [Oligoflexia bacterium]|nr:ribonuclease HII [Oligoflexia bacterium]